MDADRSRFRSSNRAKRNAVRFGGPGLVPGLCQLPDGTEIKVYWDWDENGPDVKDPQPIVGDQLGEANFNVFLKIC